MNKNILKSFFSVLVLFSFLSSMFAQDFPKPFPVKRQENAETWKQGGWKAINDRKASKAPKKKAKNVILFIGDGMGISTLTAARILEGQLRGESGEENRLSFEEFPYTAFSKTYSANQQTSDSAPTMSAIISGVKTDEGVFGVSQNAVFNDYKTVKGNETVTLLELAEQKGLSTGVVSTARLTHATPGACYAHTASRDWESDGDIAKFSKEAYEAKFPDIARQLIEFPYGDGLEVAMGGGRTKFIPAEMADPEHKHRMGERKDGRNLPDEWLKKYKNSGFVQDREQFEKIDAGKTDHLLGLFEPSHMQYEHDRKNSGNKEPSLTEMTTKSIDILSRNKKGYFLMVEGGRVDHAHHDGNAFRALTEAIELSNAVRAASQKVNLDETLIIVTADHSHVFTIAGYPARGNDILGLVREINSKGETDENPMVDTNKKPYTTLGYANGPGFRKDGRPELKQEEVTKPDYKQEATVPMTAETHGGEDVAIFAIGPNSHLIRGSMEQNWIFYVMADALRLKN